MLQYNNLDKNLPKEQGKNNYKYYNGKMNTSAFKKLTLEGNLHRALDREELCLYYQPKVSAVTGTCTSWLVFESL